MAVTDATVARFTSASLKLVSSVEYHGLSAHEEKHFPWDVNDRDELSNEISKGKI